MLRQLRLLDETPEFWRADDATVLIRSSDRAKRLILKVVFPYQLELVVPRRTRPRAVEEFLNSNRDWIRRAHDELRARYPAARRQLPTNIALTAIDRAWRVELTRTGEGSPSLRDRTTYLDLRVPGTAETAAFELLRRWLLRQGRRYLRPWLAAEAARVGLAPTRVQIRTQRTRWGSCSHHGSISLNAALLLLPPALARYLLVHELCHLRHLDHSLRYWRAVASFEPDYRAHDRALAAAWTEIPVWALPR